jgi:hypothetical protein
MSFGRTNPVLRARRRVRGRFARIFPLVLAAFACFAASAQAHTGSATTACSTASGNSITLDWTNFANPAGSNNGGKNTPPWQIVYTPTVGSPTTLTGTVSFPLDSDSLTVAIPSGAGTAVASSTWTASETSDSDANSWTKTLTIPACLASPAIATTASTSSASGEIHDNAVLSSGRAPTGKITFTLYKASDQLCQTALASGTATVNGNGTYASPVVTETTPGTYQWIASYGGDANNTAVSDGCGEAAEQVAVSKETPTILTTASTSSPAGVISDNAVLNGGNAPSGAITFNLYKASDTSCATSLATGTTTVSGDGTYTSPTVTELTPGTYQWVASYSGDTDNEAVAEACVEAAEQVTVLAASPTIVTTASKSSATGLITDNAVLSGGNAPTGTITFNLYKASDTTCATSLATGTTTVSGNGSYSSPVVTEKVGGKYQWVASYSGDTDNAAVADACGEAAEQVAVPVTAVKGVCVVSPVHLTGVIGRVRNSFTAHLTGIGVRSVKFYLDRHLIKTVRESKDHVFSITINARKLSYGGHRLVAIATMKNRDCAHVDRAGTFVRVESIIKAPVFTG